MHCLVSPGLVRAERSPALENQREVCETPLGATAQAVLDFSKSVRRPWLISFVFAFATTLTRLTA
jgi:hypothetical protein